MDILPTLSTWFPVRVVSDFSEIWFNDQSGRQTFLDWNGWLKREQTNVSPIEAYLDWAAGLLVADEGNNRYAFA